MHGHRSARLTDHAPARADATRAALLVLLTLVPAVATKLGPAPRLAADSAFLTIYVQTFPLALATTVACVLMARPPFDEVAHTAVTAGALLVVAAIWGVEFSGAGFMEYGSAHIHGHVVLQAACWTGLALLAYALQFGWFMFLVSLAVGASAAFWVVAAGAPPARTSARTGKNPGRSRVGWTSNRSVTGRNS